MQALPAGQSLAALQPHAPLLHRWPALLLVQSTHDPLVAQAFAAVPGAQLPPLQQPPLHRWVTSQPVVEQTPETQAIPAGQSLPVLQPQAPFTHK
jgi:hypothetical protein